MILPTKHIPTRQSLLGLGSLLIQNIEGPTTMSELWDRLRGRSEIGSFQRFILALDLLYAIGAIEVKEGLLQRNLP